jgi:hypothetical protein
LRGFALLFTLIVRWFLVVRLRSAQVGWLLLLFVGFDSLPAVLLFTVVTGLLHYGYLFTGYYGCYVATDWLVYRSRSVVLRYGLFCCWFFCWFLPFTTTPGLFAVSTVRSTGWFTPRFCVRSGSFAGSAPHVAVWFGLGFTAGPPTFTAPFGLSFYSMLSNGAQRCCSSSYPHAGWREISARFSKSEKNFGAMAPMVAGGMLAHARQRRSAEMTSRNARNRCHARYSRRARQISSAAIRTFFWRYSPAGGHVRGELTALA